MKTLTLCLGLGLAMANPVLGSERQPLVVDDVAGDANFLNDGGEYTSGDMPTSTSDPSLDLLQVVLAPVERDEVAVGFTVTFTLLAPLEDDVMVGLKARTPNCPDILLRYVHAPNARGRLETGCDRDVTTVGADADGNRLTLTVPFSALPPEALADNVFTTVNASTQIHLATLPGRGPVGSYPADTTLRRATYTLR
jgi:hypothetical protein